MSGHPLHVVIGPDEHGVTAYARRTALAAGGEVLRVPEGHRPDPAVALAVRGRPVVVHVTDRLLGRTATEAATRLADLLAPAGSRLLVLHDLPQESDSAAYLTRVAGYEAVAALADVLAVSSAHEARLLAEVSDAPVHVVPHAVIAHDGEAVAPAEVPPTPVGPPSVTTLGFLYPGKGVEEVLDACAGLPDRPEGLVVRNLGRCSPGHEHIADDLAARARRLGLQWSTTGWLDDTSLERHLEEASVPVAAHQHLSASGSIHAWIGAGRRPLVTRSPYTVELDGRLPGAVTLVDDLTEAIAEALAHPASTWRDPSTHVGPSEAEVGRLLLSLLRTARR